MWSSKLEEIISTCTYWENISMFSVFSLLCLELGQASRPACSAGFSLCIECKNRVIRAFFARDFSRSRLCRLSTSWHPGSLSEGIAHAGTESRNTFSCLLCASHCMGTKWLGHLRESYFMFNVQPAFLPSKCNIVAFCAF